MKVGSLFSGIGGLDLGFERAGFEVAWQVEIEPYCRKVLAKHWPSVPKYEDVRDVGAANLEWVDVIVGGFPCQDISNAGKRAGITGERSGLWSEFYRVVCEIRPRYIVVENVAALLHRGIDRVLGDLSEGGYDAEWQVLSAAAFGAPHLRNRVFIVAYSASGCVGRQGEGNKDARLGFTGCREGQHRTNALKTVADTAKYGRERAGATWDRRTGLENGCANVAHAPCQQAGQVRQPRLFTDFRTEGDGDTARLLRSAADRWAVEPTVGRVANGIPRRVDRLRGLGNAVVPQVAQYVAECVKVHAERVTT